ncbi:MAG: hypothetical protein JO057_22390 [Chloroflexi bacterium]|nr:hypothetical protein [Chloroflexota bacterium]
MIAPPAEQRPHLVGRDADGVLHISVLQTRERSNHTADVRLPEIAQLVLVKLVLRWMTACGLRASALGKLLARKTGLRFVSHGSSAPSDVPMDLHGADAVFAMR